MPADQPIDEMWIWLSDEVDATIIPSGSQNSDIQVSPESFDWFVDDSDIDWEITTQIIQSTEYALVDYIPPTAQPPDDPWDWSQEIEHHLSSSQFQNSDATTVIVPPVVHDGWDWFITDDDDQVTIDQHALINYVAPVSYQYNDIPDFDNDTDVEIDFYDDFGNDDNDYIPPDAWDWSDQSDANDDLGIDDGYQNIIVVAQPSQQQNDYEWFDYDDIEDLTVQVADASIGADSLPLVDQHFDDAWNWFRDDDADDGMQMILAMSSDDVQDVADQHIEDDWQWFDHTDDETLITDDGIVGPDYVAPPSQLFEELFDDNQDVVSIDNDIVDLIIKSSEDVLGGNKVRPAPVIMVILQKTTSMLIS